MVDLTGQKSFESLLFLFVSESQFHICAKKQPEWPCHVSCDSPLCLCISRPVVLPATS